jgi:hypothetical protein
VVGPAGGIGVKRKPGRPKGAKGTRRGTVRVNVYAPGRDDDTPPPPLIEKRDVPRIDRTPETMAHALILARILNRESAAVAAKRVGANATAVRLHYRILRERGNKLPGAARGRPRKGKAA